MDIFVGYLAAIIESIVLYIYIYIYLGIKSKYKKFIFLFIILETIFVLCLDYYYNVFGVSLIYGIVFEFFSINLISYARIEKKLLIVIFYNFILCSIDLLVYLSLKWMFNISFEEIYNINFVNAILSILSKLILLVVTGILVHIEIKKIYNLSVKYLLCSYLVGGISIFFMFVLVDYTSKSNLSHNKLLLLYIIIIGILVSNIMQLYNYYNLVIGEKRKAEIESLNLQIGHYRNIENAYKQISALRHDYQKHINILQILVANKKYQEIKKYLDNFSNEIFKTPVTIFTNNTIIDALINQLLCNAEKNGIRVIINAEKINVKIDRLMHINIIIGNLLENALEGAVAYNNSLNKLAIIMIKVYMREVEEDKKYLVIKTENSSIPPKKKNGYIISSKRNKKLHGIGLKNIQFGVDEMGGEFSVAYKDGKFYANIQIPFRV